MATSHTVASLLFIMGNQPNGFPHVCTYAWILGHTLQLLLMNEDTTVDEYSITEWIFCQLCTVPVKQLTKPSGKSNLGIECS